MNMVRGCALLEEVREGDDAAYEKGAPKDPLSCLEAKPGFEPGVKALQASALPLGHFAINMRRAD